MRVYKNPDELRQSYDETLYDFGNGRLGIWNRDTEIHDVFVFGTAKSGHVGYIKCGSVQSSPKGAHVIRII